MAIQSITTRLGTSSNLQPGGTYDILMTNFSQGYPQGKISFNIDGGADKVPRKISGIQKVAQTFIKILFTSRGSNVISPRQGTDFQNLTIGANIQANDQLLMANIKSEVRDAESQTKIILNSGSDPTSKLASISVMAIDKPNKDSIYLYLRLVTMAGEYAQVALPFPQMNLALTA